MLYEIIFYSIIVFGKTKWNGKMGNKYILADVYNLTDVTDRADPLHWVHLPVAAERIITVSEYACYVNFCRMAFFHAHKMDEIIWK